VLVIRMPRPGGNEAAMRVLSGHSRPIGRFGACLSGSRREVVLHAEAAVVGWSVAPHWPILMSMHRLVHELSEVGSRGETGGIRSNQRAILYSRFSCC
jgi:hypothetical protein